MNPWWTETDKAESVREGYDRIGMCAVCNKIIGLNNGLCGKCGREK